MFQRNYEYDSESTDDEDEAKSFSPMNNENFAMPLRKRHLHLCRLSTKLNFERFRERKSSIDLSR